MRAVIVLTLILLLPAGGCATDRDRDQEPCTGQRVLVTTASTAQLTIPELQALLTDASGVPVRHMRTLFERHNLFCVTEVTSEQTFRQALAGMQAQPEIQAVEPDRRRKINN